jgi:hypothetical protein
MKSRVPVFPCGVLCVWLLGSTVYATLTDLARPIDGRSMRSTSTHKLADGKPDPDSNGDNSNVKPGEKVVLLDVKGPGVITHMWFTFLAPEPHPWAKNGSASHQEMVLRIFWDGDSVPAVEAPLGDFFANSFGRRSEVISIPVIVEDADSYNCFWQMPFRKSARVEIENQSPDKPISLLYYNIDWVKKDRISKDTPYFYARYRQEYPVEQGKDYVVLDTRGKGHYVGTVLSGRTRSPSWFGEGDEKIYIDGEKDASIWGTGTEDYFLSAWGLQETGTPYFGVPCFDQWGIVGGHTSAYRWHIQDPIVFEKGIKVTFEHFGWISPDENPNYKSESWNERQDDYSSVAFWYQTGKSSFNPPMPSAPQRQLPSLESKIVYAGEFADGKYHGEGAASLQPMQDLYPKGHLFYAPASKESGWLEIPFTVETKEPVRLLITATQAPDYGKYQATLNGVKIGPVLDFYHESVRSWEYHLLDFWPEPGNYTLRLECIGKSFSSEDYKCGIESVRLRQRRPRVTEYGHDKDKNWQETPLLYD